MPGPSSPRSCLQGPLNGATYSTLSNSVEGMNGYIKDGAHEAVDDPERRRIRGSAPQSILLAFLLFAANLRKIDEFLKARASETKGKKSANSRPVGAPGPFPPGLRRPQSSWERQTPLTIQTHR